MDERVFTGIAVMAAVTYIIRATPMALIRSEIKNRFFRSFLHYVPYAALSVMLFPSILFAAGGIWPSALGFIVALVLAWKKKSLITVALFSCAVAYAAQKLIGV